MSRDVDCTAERERAARGKGHNLEHLKVPGGNFFFPWHCPVQWGESIPETTAASMVPEVPPHSSSIQLWANPMVSGDILGVKLIFEAVPGCSVG